MSKYADADKWDLMHAIINTVKFAAGMPLSTAKNPYYRRLKDETNNHGSSDVGAPDTAVIHSVSM